MFDRSGLNGQSCFTPEVAKNEGDMPSTILTLYLVAEYMLFITFYTGPDIPYFNSL